MVLGRCASLLLQPGRLSVGDAELNADTMPPGCQESTPVLSFELHGKGMSVMKQGCSKQGQAGQCDSCMVGTSIHLLPASGLQQQLQFMLWGLPSRSTLCSTAWRARRP